MPKQRNENLFNKYTLFIPLNNVHFKTPLFQNQDVNAEMLRQHCGELDLNSWVITQENIVR